MIMGLQLKVVIMILTDFIDFYFLKIVVIYVNERNNKTCLRSFFVICFFNLFYCYVFRKGINAVILHVYLISVG